MLQLRVVASLTCIALLLASCTKSAADGAPPKAAPPPVPAWAKVSPLQIAAAAKLSLPVAVELDLGGVPMKLVLIPAGRFMMGSAEGEQGKEDDEGPQHLVRLTQPFYMGLAEVTQRQYEAITGANPSQFKGPDNPVEGVPWDDAQGFCKKLNQHVAHPPSGGGDAQPGAAVPQGWIVRLPTEAQWEYACRAGTTTRYCYGDDAGRLGEYTWYAGNSNGSPHPVKRLKPNAWGLYGMHGNVAEWCEDWYDRYAYPAAAVSDPLGPASGSYRALRGGNWGLTADGCRSAQRGGDTAAGNCAINGFRVVVVPGVLPE